MRVSPVDLIRNYWHLTPQTNNLLGHPVLAAPPENSADEPPDPADAAPRRYSKFETVISDPEAYAKSAEEALRRQAEDAAHDAEQACERAIKEQYPDGIPEVPDENGGGDA
jgi:hypothetical protein